ncbi:MAG TPA: VWA domain-containing protein [Thermoanaerobaculia bacterium]|nr:VWA domain-containing protein [Thermoanaerobaculia bacterium]
MYRPRPVFVIPALLSLAGLPGILPASFAQGSPPAKPQDETFFEAVEVNVVNVEVFVTDKSGKFVPGLTQADFEVLEDGKPVEITNFYGAQETALSQSAAAAPVQVPEEQRLYLTVFFDNQTLTPPDRNRVTKEIEKFVRTRLRPEDRVMVVSYDGPGSLQVRQPSTSDPAAVVAALKEVSSGNAGGLNRLTDLRQILTQLSQGDTDSPESAGGAQGTAEVYQGGGVASAEAVYESIRLYSEQRYQEIRSSLRTLGRFVDALSGLPGRKAVLYVSGGMSLRPAQALFEAYQTKYGDIQRRIGLQVTLDAFQTDTTVMFREIGERANANRITFYSLGLPTTPGAGQDLLWTGTQETLEAQNLTQSLLLVTSPTGGLAAFDPNRANVLLEQMRHDFHHYYSLGYSPPPRTRAGNHKITVKVKRPGLEVRHREAYHHRNAKDRLHHQTYAALLFRTGNENPLDVSLLVDGERPAPQRGQREVSLLVTFPMAKLVLLPQEQFHEGRVTVMIGARDTQGRTSDLMQIDVPVRVPNAQMEQSQEQSVAYRTTLLLGNDPQTLVVAVRDEYGNVDSTITADYAEAGRTPVPSDAPNAPGTPGTPAAPERKGDR